MRLDLLLAVHKAFTDRWMTSRQLAGNLEAAFARVDRASREGHERAAARAIIASRRTWGPLRHLVGPTGQWPARAPFVVSHRSRRRDHPQARTVANREPGRSSAAGADAASI